MLKPIESPLKKAVCRLCHVCFGIVVVLLATTQALSAQAAPSVTGGGFGRAYVFGEFTAGRPNYGTDFILGPTIGGYFTFNNWLSGEARGSMLRWGPSPFHQSVAVFGPRVQFRVGALKPYTSFEAGIAHAVYPDPAGTNNVGSNVFTWEAIGGADYRLNRRLSIRVGEFSYGSIKVLSHGLNPKSISSGIVVHIF